MDRIVRWRRVVVGCLVSVAAGVPGGCPPAGPIAPIIASVTVSGTLVQGEESTVELTATVIDIRGRVEAVRANLSEIGGASVQALAPVGNGVWTATRTVTPDEPGQFTVTFTATDDEGLSSRAAAAVMVEPSPDDGNGGDGTGPQITDPSVTGTLVVGRADTVTVAVTVTDPDGTVSAVTADLSQIGGFVETPLALEDGDLWTFSGLIVPLTAGTQVVTFTAFDDLGNTATATAEIVVNSASPGS